MTASPTERHSAGRIFRFWIPLAATWLMMAAEGPFLAAVIARLADPKFNLAAHGVAYAFAILVEAPVIMLMSASTALVEDEPTLQRMRRFTWALNVGVTALLLVVLIRPIYDGIMSTLLGLPDEVSGLVYGALWLFLPWPAAIGYRRFLQGLLIRADRTRLVAVGTVFRLAGMAATGLLLYLWGGIPGAWVGAAALSVGVVTEAVAVRIMARETLDELEGRTTPVDADAIGLDYGRIAGFYWPLALTSLIGLTVQPMLTFFMGRAPSPIESLAVFPVVHSLSFIFRSLGLSYQEAAIALLGKECEHAPEVGRFAFWLGLAASGGLALVAFVPAAADFWFVTVSGLEPELAAFALTPARIVAPLPALSVLLSFQRASLVQGRRTGPITGASVTEVVGIAILFSALGWGVGLVGVTAASIAFVGGRVGGNLFLLRPTARVLARDPSPTRP